MGGRVRNLAILETLAPDFDLEIITLVHDPKRLRDPGRVAELGRWVPVLAEHRRSPAHRVWGQVRYRFQGRGWERETWFLSSPAVARAVERALHERPPAIVHSAYWFTLRHLRDRPRPPLWVVDTHDVQFERWERLRGRVNPIEREAEILELSRNDLVVAITPHDEEVFRGVLPPRVRLETIGMGVDLAHWSRRSIGDPPRGSDVAYYGYMANDVNRRAAIHLCTEILPELRKRRRDARVVIIGADPAPDVKRLAEIPGVRVTGAVDDPRPHLAACGVFALSLRAASGLRSRACEVMALDVPVVAYPESLEGMGFEPDRDYLEAHDPAEFAQRIDDLLTDGVRAAKIADSAKAEVRARYGLAATYGRFTRLYRDLCGMDHGSKRDPEAVPRGPHEG
jgi:glycosyltransferase involved in cell wall biosynthesis